MADKTIWDYPTLATADPNDLILMASDEETYNMKVETLKNAMGEAASKPPQIINGTWRVWDAHVEAYVDTGISATGAAAGFGTVSASVDSNTGTPSVDITTSGPATAKNFTFSFHNLVGTVTPEVQALADSVAENADRAEAAAQTVRTKVYHYSVTVPTTGWTSGDIYSISIAVQGLLSTDNCGMVEVVYTGNEAQDLNLRIAYQGFVRVSAANDGITVYAYHVPEVAVPLNITVFRETEATPHVDDGVLYMDNSTGWVAAGSQLQVY